MAPNKGTKLEAVICPICNDFTSKRLTSFEKHLQECHKTNSQELWIKIHGEPFCRCGCGKQTTWISWKRGFTTVRVGHNASIYAVYDKDEAERLSLTRGSNWRGKESHWKGKTKETDAATALRGQATSVGRKEAIALGDIKIWSKGLTKETDGRLAVLSQIQKERFATGEQRPWCEGLTKETDERVATMAVNVSIAHKKEEIRKYLDEKKRVSPQEIKERIEKNSTLKVTSNLEDYINDKITLITVLCSKCNNSIDGNLRTLQRGRCTFCFPLGSAGQASVSVFIQSLGIEVIDNCRSIITPLEIDIFAPAHNFGIEYNGLYTHNEMSKSAIYHSNKTERCNEKGVRLFHIFEDEWVEKPEIIKSMIRHRLGVSTNKFFARKCLLKELSIKQRRDFFDQNHIDGDVNSKVAFGLFHNEVLIAAISLRKAFHKKHENMLEVARFCTLLNSSVIGGLSKLTLEALRYAYLNEYRDGLISYVDTRHGHGEGYVSANYKKIGKTANRFWWTDSESRFNRFKFRADSKANLTEAQVASEHNVVKIWGCPNLIFQIR